MKLHTFAGIFAAATLFVSCKKEESKVVDENITVVETPFDYVSEQFGDIKVLRYQVSNWDKLTLKEKELVYYLTQAGTAGRDIMWDQNYKHNLKIRTALENIYQNYSGDKASKDWENFEIYLKRVWFANGIHHHYSMDKIKPDFNQAYFESRKLPIFVFY